MPMNIKTSLLLCAWSCYGLGIQAIHAQSSQTLTDVTDMCINNAKFLSTSSSYYDSNTSWNTDISGGNLRILNIEEGVDVSAGECTEQANALERWTPSAFPSDKKILFQSTQLPNGSYILKVAAQCADLTISGKPNADIMYVYANDQQTKITNAKSLSYYEIPCEVTNGELEIGVKTGISNTNNYVCIADVSLSVEDETVDGTQLTEQAKALMTQYGIEDEKINSLIEKVQTGNTAKEKIKAFYSLKNSLTEYQYINASEEHPFNVTDKLINPTGTQSSGWERNAMDAAAGYNKHNPEFDSDSYKGIGIESWYNSPLQNSELIWQDITGLMPGHYKIRAKAVGQIYNNTVYKGENRGQLYLFANEARTPITSNVWSDVEVECDVYAGSKLRIGIAAGTDNENDWVSIAQVEIECTAIGKPEKIALNENYDICSVTADTYADVYLSKFIPHDNLTWLCLPFDMEETQVNTYFSQVLETVSADIKQETLYLELKPVERIEAGKAYLVQAATADLEQIILEKVMIKHQTPQPQVIGQDIILNGTYRLTDGITGAYLLTENASELIKADSHTKAKGFGAYITTNATEVETLGVNMHAIVTSIQTNKVLKDSSNIVDVYTLSGICVRHQVSRSEAFEGLPKGIYIVNNHTFIKK